MTRKASESIPQIFSKEIIVDSENNILTIRGDGISGLTAEFTSLTASNLNVSNIQILNISSSQGQFAILTGSIVTGSTALFNRITGSSGYFANNVGIGTSSPSSSLDVNGIISIGGIPVINTINNTNDIRGNLRVLSNDSTVNQDGMFINYNSTGGGNADIRFYASGTTERMRIVASNGNTIISGDLSVSSNTGSLNLRKGTTNTIEAHIRPEAGKKGYLSFTENTVADRWIVGIDNGDDALLFKAGSVVANTERMRITGNGNVGIGTSNPVARLDVDSAANAWARWRASTTSGSFMSFVKGGTSTDIGYIGTDAGGIINGGVGNNFGIRSEYDLLLMAGSAERARITSAGNVGIGTASPSDYLEIKSNGSFNTIIGTRAWWGGGNYHTIYSTAPDNYIMLGFPHVPYLESGSNGYTGTTRGALVRYGANSALSSYWDAGIASNIGSDKYAIRRADSANAFLAIDNIGNVGIGTNSPQVNSKLHVAGGSSDVRLRIDTTSADPLLTWTTNGQQDWSAGIDFSDSGKFKIQNSLTAGTLTRLTIDTTGRVGIGTESPATALQVQGEARSLNFSDNNGNYNVNLGNGNLEGRGLVAGYSGGSYGGIGYNIRHTTTGGTYISPLADTTNYIQFSQGFQFLGDAGTTAGRTTNFTELMRITNAGNVGIGTTSPTQAKLVISAPDESVSSAISIRQSNALNYGFDFALDQTVNGNGYFYGIDANTRYEIMQFTRDTTPDLYLVNGGGNVGIGTTSPSAKLSVKGVGTGIVDIGQWAGSSNYGAIYLNGDTSTNNYNILSAGTDKELYLNRPTGQAIRFRMNNADQMVLENNGRLGIGTTGPATLLHVSGNSGLSIDTINAQWANIGANVAAANYMQLKRPGSAAALGYIGGGAGGAISAGTQNDLAIRSEADLYLAAGGNNPRVLIDTAGNVGIGAAVSPTQTLDVNGTMRLRTLVAGTNAGFGRNATTGEITALTSDERLKKDINTITGSLDLINNLRGVTFKWDDTRFSDFIIEDVEKEKTQIGLIAQEVEQVLPQLVYNNGVQDLKAVKYSEIVAVLIEGIKELKSQVNSLKTEIEVLKSGSI